MCARKPAALRFGIGVAELPSINAAISRMANTYRDLQVWQSSIDLAEGWGRRSRIEYRRFIQIALGSNDELQTQLIIAERFGFGNKRMLADSAALSSRIGRMLVALHRVLHRQSLGPNP